MVRMRVVKPDDLHLEIAGVTLDSDEISGFNGVPLGRSRMSIPAAHDLVNVPKLSIACAKQHSATLVRILVRRVFGDA